MINLVYMKTFKACIFDDTRTLAVHYIKKKQRLGANAFRIGRTKKEIGEVYIINPHCTIITTTKRLGVPFRYQTCYYKRNIPVAVDIDNLDGGKSAEQLVLLTAEKDDNKIVGAELQVAHPIPIPTFENLEKYNDITSEELATLFDPQFYKMIAKANVDKKGDQLWLMQIGSLLGISFIIYYMMQQLPKTLVAALVKVLAGH